MLKFDFQEGPNKASTRIPTDYRWTTEHVAPNTLPCTPEQLSRHNLVVLSLLQPLYCNTSALLESCVVNASPKRFELWDQVCVANAEQACWCLQEAASRAMAAIAAPFRISTPHAAGDNITHPSWSP